jgi:hypothetical protein
VILVSPIWLILLAPWAALGVWLLSGRLKDEEVPFLPLWEADPPQIQPPARSWQKPPIAIAALLAGLLFAIAAASGPAISTTPATTLPAAPQFEIESLSVQTSPTTQAMLRLKNLSDVRQGTITIAAHGKPLHTTDIQLPAKYESQDYFADVPLLAEELNARVDVAGQTGSTGATLQGAWPAIDTASAVSPELRRMIDVYSRHRPLSDSSIHIAIQDSFDSVAAAEPTAIVPNDLTNQRSISSQDSLIVADSPLTRSIDWATALSDARFAPAPVGDWQPLVSVSGVPILVIHTTPVRQVWVGFNSEQFLHLPDFVVFWTSVFDWLGNPTPSYHSSRPSNDLNLPSSNVSQPSKSLAGQTLIIALLLLGLSAAAWKPTPFTHRNPLNS